MHSEVRLNILDSYFVAIFTRIAHITKCQLSTIVPDNNYYYDYYVKFVRFHICI